MRKMRRMRMTSEVTRSAFVRELVLGEICLKMWWTGVAEIYTALSPEVENLLEKEVSYAFSELLENGDIMACYVDGLRIPRSKWAYQTTNFVHEAARFGYDGFYPRINRTENVAPLFGMLVHETLQGAVTSHDFTRNYLRGCSKAFKALWSFVDAIFKKDAFLTIQIDPVDMNRRFMGQKWSTLVDLATKNDFFHGGLFPYSFVQENRHAKDLVDTDLTDTTKIPVERSLQQHPVQTELDLDESGFDYLVLSDEAVVLRVSGDYQELTTELLRLLSTDPSLDPSSLEAFMVCSVELPKLKKVVLYEIEDEDEHES